MNRYFFTQARTLYHVIKDPKYRGLVVSMTIILLTGTVVFHFVEGWRWLDSFYFCVISLTTVGYGDFTPQTDLGKILTIIYLLSGIGVLLGFINALLKKRDELDKL